MFTSSGLNAQQKGDLNKLAQAAGGKMAENWSEARSARFHASAGSGRELRRCGPQRSSGGAQVLTLAVFFLPLGPRFSVSRRR